ncbi:LapA family protein [Thauera sp. WH-1]|uniref:LapA family protein n=1 Tax=Thauera sp. WH-1 TaxID=3398230 RepID=UPI002B7B605F|nr:LapA family protein [Thauera sp.]
MRAIIWFIRLLLFFLLFGFAIKNDHLVTLSFFFGSQWQLPLVFVILLTFAAGALLGVTATLASLIGQRREISRLRRQLEQAERDKALATATPAAAEAQLPMP